MPPLYPPAKPHKPYFFYGHRKPSLNRPVVRGGLFSNRQTLKLPNPPKTPNPNSPSQPFDIQKWDPHFLSRTPSSPPSNSPSPQLPLSYSQRLSPIARFIIDAFRKNRYHWGPPVVSELRKLRRVTPSLVAEVLKVENNPAVAAKFFHWAAAVT